MKKFFLILSALMLAAVTSVSADDISPSVRVDGRGIIFRDEQAPVILDNRVYVPIRRVLNSMDAKVTWNDADRSVTIESKDNITRLLLKIDSPEIQVTTFTSLLSADKTVITSDVAPKIINDKTMLPIRVIAESLGATVCWDDATKTTTITTKHAKEDAINAGAKNTEDNDFSISEFYKDSLPILSLGCDAENIKEGDTVKVRLKLDGIEKISDSSKICCVTASVFYNPDNFKYEGFTLIENGERKNSQLEANNPAYYPDCVKMISINLAESAYVPGNDGVILEAEFTALNSLGGDFFLSDGISTIGHDCELVITDENTDYFTVSEFDEVYIDTSAVTVK